MVGKGENMSDYINQRRMDWHLFWTAAGVVIALGTIVIGCYINLRNDLNTIKTVLIVKGIMPSGLVKNIEEKQ